MGPLAVLMFLILMAAGWYWLSRRGPAGTAPTVEVPPPRAVEVPTLTNTAPRLKDGYDLSHPANRTNISTNGTNLADLKPVAVPEPMGTNLNVPNPATVLRSQPPELPKVSTEIPKVTNMLLAQIALNQMAISSGSVDGVGGEQTASALRACQLFFNLEQTGRLDRDTLRMLELHRPPNRLYRISSSDLARLVRTPDSWLEKSRLRSLDYETILELIAEKAHAHPRFLQSLNPGIDWARVAEGTPVVVPDNEYPVPRHAALVRVSLGEHWIRAFDGKGELLCHFPCSIGRIAEKRPVGALKVTVSVQNPNYTFNPDVFPESEEARKLGRKLLIPAGPNNPVGVAWIGLNRPGYGIHGTPKPEQVGRTESHGCFRLANWNAEYLRRMVSVGTPVWIDP
jgi:lipoprotein-anchoring transpeptidase ErfK/SrfK